MEMQKELLDILACPRCRGVLEALGPPSLETSPESSLEGLCCRACAVVYPVRDGIPVMLIEEAQPLSAWRSDSRPT